MLVHSLSSYRSGAGGGVAGGPGPAIQHLGRDSNSRGDSLGDSSGIMLLGGAGGSLWPWDLMAHAEWWVGTPQWELGLGHDGVWLPQF